MRNLDRSLIELTKSQLLIIKNKIQSWGKKDQIIDIMRCRDDRLEDKAV